MIKLKNNILTREPIPQFLIGLAPETLLDLSWTDPALGVQDCKWLPENDISEPLQEYEQYGVETLTLDGDVVNVSRAVLPWPIEEVDAHRLASVPQQVTMRQCRLALLANGLLDSVEAAIASIPASAKATADIEWGYASVVERNSGLMPAMAAALGLTETQIDGLFIQAE
jgi:hypothetical protein